MRFRGTKVLASVGVAAVVLLLAACGSSSSSTSSSGASSSTSSSSSSSGNGGATAPGVTATSITFGTHQPLTGPAAPGYSEIAPASQAYFDYVNAHGGVYGRQVHLIIKDDAYNPTITVNVVHQLVLQDNVFGLRSCRTGTACSFRAVHPARRRTDCGGRAERRQVEEIPRVEVAVAQEFEHRSVQHVAAGLRHYPT